MRKTIHVLALTLIWGGMVSGTFARSAQADDDDNKFCSKFSRKIEKKARQGKSYEIDSRRLSQYRAYCLGRGNGFSSNPGNYSSNNGYTYTRGSTTGSPDGGYSRSSQSTYSSNTTNGGYTQQRSSQTNNSYDPYDDYGYDDRRYDDRPSVNVATPNSQVRVQNGGVTIRTRNTGGTGINLDF